MTHYSLPSLLLCSASSWSFVSALNSRTQNCRKSQILRLPKVPRLKHEFQARYVIMVIMVNYIPRFNFVYKLQCFQVVPSQGIMTSNYAQSWNFVKPREGYFITFELFSHPQGREFDQKVVEKFKCSTYNRTVHPTPPLRPELSKTAGVFCISWNSVDSRIKGDYH